MPLKLANSFGSPAGIRSRNHYDRLGHFAQGFIPAILAREILLRTSPLRQGKWLFVIVTCICLAFIPRVADIDLFYVSKRVTRQKRRAAQCKPYRASGATRRVAFPGAPKAGRNYQRPLVLVHSMR